jgi:DNA-binding CsgD family transcriptional regulator
MLEQGREAYSRSAWAEAYESLVRADEVEPLAADDLDRLAISLFMLGREDEWLSVMERAYQRRTEDGEPRGAARTAFWIGTWLVLRGEIGPATGWLGRAARLLEGEGECVEQGYMLMPVAFQHEAEGDVEGAVATAAAAAEIGRRFGDKDLFASPNASSSPSSWHARPPGMHFEELGATPDIAAVEALEGKAGGRHGLTARELEVLRLVATGKSNREIASALVISEHTVARHVQNILRKLAVASRTAAGAFAYEHDLV